MTAFAAPAFGQLAIFYSDLSHLNLTVIAIPAIFMRHWFPPQIPGIPLTFVQGRETDNKLMPDYYSLLFL